MKILVACEESQAVCKAFRAKGHEAYSCDIQECSGGHPEWHIVADVLEVINGGSFVTQARHTAIVNYKWDMMIGFPPCFDLSSVGALYWPGKQKDGRQMRAIEFVMNLYNSKIEKVCIENPVGILSTVWKKPDQIIHPFYFGDPYRKKTCFWLKNLPPLEYRRNLFHDADTMVTPIASWISSSTRGGEKKDGTRTPCPLPALKRDPKERSKTFPGIAAAMAEQ